ncbi:uncharacterized protein LOC143290772 [Babylonia areolata]|uniref:uncharacterized protein LOC143290772 n=1 Tax=Babylonia areolata TaxID=304850 RepID=UPI003FD1B58D
MRFPDGKTISKSVAIGTLSTYFRAEACALLLAAKTFSQEDTLPTNTVFLTDCKSILQSVQAPGGEQIIRDIRQELNLLKQRTAVVLQWIPSHCGIGGNEEADRLSKAGSPPSVLQRGKTDTERQLQESMAPTPGHRAGRRKRRHP